MARYPHWTMEPCLHTEDLSRRLKAAGALWLRNPVWRAAWEQRLAQMKQDPDYAEDLKDKTIEEALTNGVIATILIEQGLQQMQIPRGAESQAN